MRPGGEYSHLYSHQSLRPAGGIHRLGASGLRRRIRYGLILVQVLLVVAPTRAAQLGWRQARQPSRE
jgi:hypothetical protein